MLNIKMIIFNNILITMLVIEVRIQKLVERYSLVYLKLYLLINNLISKTFFFNFILHQDWAYIYKVFFSKIEMLCPRKSNLLMFIKNYCFFCGFWGMTRKCWLFIVIKIHTVYVLIKYISVEKQSKFKVYFMCIEIGNFVRSLQVRKYLRSNNHKDKFSQIKNSSPSYK